jgi:hypothetical protein
LPAFGLSWIDVVQHLKTPQKVIVDFGFQIADL